jgi:hypothetical protein
VVQKLRIDEAGGHALNWGVMDLERTPPAALAESAARHGAVIILCLAFVSILFMPSVLPLLGGAAVGLILLAPFVLVERGASRLFGGRGGAAVKNSSLIPASYACYSLGLASFIGGQFEHYFAYLILAVVGLLVTIRRLSRIRHPIVLLGLAVATTLAWVPGVDAREPAHVLWYAQHSGLTSALVDAWTRPGGWVIPSCIGAALCLCLAAYVDWRRRAPR